MYPIYFVHIPKTAGTSFRLGVEQSLGRDAIAYNYGPASSETSDLVKNLVHGDEGDLWSFYRACIDLGIRFVGGHVGIGAFVSGFQVMHTVTFVRDPLQRIVSEYKHFVRHLEYKGDFREFYSKPVMQNRQSNLLKAVPLHSIGLIGISEHYEKSLKLINDKFGLSISVREDNRADSFVDSPLLEIGEEDVAMLKQLNQGDIHFYKQCVELFETRISFFEAGIEFCHAHVQQATVQAVSGWAWWQDGSAKPVEIEVLVNGESKSIKSATALSRELCWLRPPRGAHVVFSFPNVAKEGDAVQCRVFKTGQLFPSQPIIVTKR
jgi:hypothetical protein